MTAIDIRLVFHGPFRVASGSASRGLDAVVDRERIPATTVKGVMRAAAREILALEDATVERIFGGPGGASPWGWTDVALPSGADLAVTSRIRIPIDAQTGVAADGGLFHAEEIWLRVPVGCVVELTGHCADPARDARIIAACAMAVKGLGASRRRGLGWVTMAPSIDGRAVTPQEAASTVASARGGV